MKKRMPKVLLVLALVCVLAIGAAIATFADTAGETSLTGDGEWYYSITVGEATADDLEFYVELCDENGDWFTTTSLCDCWTWDGDDSLTRDDPWDEGGTYAQVGAGDEVVVEITREGGDFTVAWYINRELSYSAHCQNSTFTDTVTWHVNVVSGGDVTVNEFGEGHPVSNPAYVAASNAVTGDGSWYYAITVDESAYTDGVYYFVELFDENNDWFTTTSVCEYWTWDDDGTLYYDRTWDNGGNWETVTPGDEVIVEITRQDGTIMVAWYINGEWSYTAVCEGASFMETVTWQVNIQSGEAVSCEFGEGHPVSVATTITNVEVKNLSQNEFIVGSEFDLAGTVLTITYENGDTAELTVGEDDWWTYDAYGNGIEVYGEMEMVEEYNDGSETWTETWTESVWPNNPIYYVGTYNVVTVTEGINSWKYEYNTTETTFTVREATKDDAASAVKLVLDETYDVTTADQWFTYTPAESGYYVFKTVDGATYNGNYVTLYVDYGDGTLNFWTNDWYDYFDGVLFRCYLEAGYTYYYRTIDYYGDVTVYEVTLTEGKNVASFTVDSLGKTEFTQYIGRLDLSGTVLTVTYTDGTTATVTFGKEGEAADEYGNYFSYCVTDYVWGSDNWDHDYWYSYYSILWLDPGTYTVIFYTDTYTDTTQSITVVALADSNDTVKMELLDEAYSTEIASGDCVWFEYTPAEDGNYYLVADWDVDEDIYSNDCWYDPMRAYDEDGSYIWPDNGYVDDDCWYYDEDTDAEYVIFALEAGTTYYIPVYYNAYNEYEYYVDDASATVTLTMKQVGHVHSYANEEVSFDWADDYSTAIASLRCDTCSYIATTVNCTVTSVTTAATTEAEGSIVYTATAVINGKTYVSDPVTVILEKLAESETPTDGPTETPTEAPTETPTEAPTEAPTDGTATPTNATPSGQLSPAEGDVSVWGYVAILLGAAAAAVVLAKKKANA